MLKHIVYKHYTQLHNIHKMTTKSITSFFAPVPSDKSPVKRKIETTITTTTDHDNVKKSKTTTITDTTQSITTTTQHNNTLSNIEYNPVAEYNELEAAIPDAWRIHLQSEFTKPYWAKLKQFLATESKSNTIYPPKQHIFRALQYFAPSDIKVVIVGQDPYHGAGQAEGLCFSVPSNVAVPSSLRNIYKELSTDIPTFKKPTHGNLIKWAEQGILLLNTSLTVRANNANSHKDTGWQQFTDKIMHIVNSEANGVVFLLWGAHAQKKGAFVDTKKHHVLKTVHPSGLSAARGFFGCKHFSKCNELLLKEGKEPIDWQV